jgi:hypothetical protein
MAWPLSVLSAWATAPASLGSPEALSAATAISNTA